MSALPPSIDTHLTVTPAQAYNLARKLARKFATKYRAGHLLEDLIQEAAMAIEKARESHQPERGMPFVKWATLWANQAMKNARRTQAGPILIPWSQGVSERADQATELNALSRAVCKHERPDAYAMRGQFVKFLREFDQDGTLEQHLKGETFKEIGQSRGVTKEAARQAEERLLKANGPKMRRTYSPSACAAGSRGEQ